MRDVFKLVDYFWNSYFFNVMKYFLVLNNWNRDLYWRIWSWGWENEGNFYEVFYIVLDMF